MRLYTMGARLSEMSIQLSLMNLYGSAFTLGLAGRALQLAALRHKTSGPCRCPIRACFARL